MKHMFSKHLLPTAQSCSTTFE